MCIVVLSLTTTAVAQTPSERDSIDQNITYHHRYPYIAFVDSAYAHTFSNEEFQAVAATVVFPVNSTRLPADNPVLVELSDEVLPVLHSDSLEVLHIDLRGAASPEGALDHNEYLSRQRMQSLLNFVQEHSQVPIAAHEMRTLSEAEDYLTLVLLMQQAGDADYERVKELCDRYQPVQDYESLKKELRSLDGGDLWRRLLKEYYPQLRTAQLVIFCRRKPAPVKYSPLPAESKVIAMATAPEAIDYELPRLRAPRRELLSVKTNLLFYGVYMPGGYNRWCPIPNVTVEYYPLHGHFTYAATFDCPWWQDYWAHKFFQIRNYQLEARYYFRSGDIRSNPPGEGQAYRGFYVQGYAHMALFGLCFDADRGWVGEGIGAGIGAGYVLPLGKKSRWKLEFALQVGFYTCKYDPYQFENLVNPDYHDQLYYYRWTQSPDLFKKRQYHHTWVGPTRVAITLSYDLLFRRNNKKGVSTRRWEWY